MSITNVPVLDVITGPLSGNETEFREVYAMGRIQEVTDGVRVFQETLLSLVNHLQQSIHLHDNVKQQFRFLSHDSVHNRPKQLQDIEQLHFVADHPSHLQLQPPGTVCRASSDRFICKSLTGGGLARDPCFHATRRNALGREGKRVDFPQSGLGQYCSLAPAPPALSAHCHTGHADSSPGTQRDRLGNGSCMLQH